MKKAVFIVTILFIAVISTACINNIAVQELNSAAKIYMEKGDYDLAIDRLESSIELDANVYETYYNLGVAYIEAKQYPKAIESLNKARNINPKYSDTYYTLAVAQEGLADSLAESNDDFETVQSEDETTGGNYPETAKERIIEEYLSSIANYRKYAELVNSEQKSDEINAHIADMEKVLNKLGYSGSSF